MSRVLLVGVGPLPSPNLERVYAPGLRLRLFLDALRLSGHSVFLAEITFGGQTIPHVPLYEKNIQAHRRLEGERKRAQAQFDGWVREFEPDVVVALTDIGALYAASSVHLGPIYVDYFGDPMAERQQQTHAHGNNDSLADAWLHLLPALIRADRFSVCSPSQRLALVGELGAAGRLNAQTCGHELIDIVPPALPFTGMNVPTSSRYMEKIGIPADGKVIFSSGGFNTWMDEETLFAGVEGALKADPTLHFVATGGAIQGHVEVVFERFQRRVFNSTVADRFHLLGWIQHEQVLEAIASAHVGVNCDFNTLEGELGCRNRLLGWLWGGMRVVTTVTSDPTRELVRQGLATEVPFGDAAALTAALLEQARLGRYGDVEALRRQLTTDWSGSSELAQVVRFCEKPVAAPDRKGITEVSNPLVDLHRQLIQERDRQQGEVSVRSYARQTGRTLLGSRLFRAICVFNPRLRDHAERLSNL